MNNKVKILIIVLIIAVPILIPVIIGVNPVSGILSPSNTEVSSNSADAAATYKTQCAMCHGPAAAKLFDLAKPDETHVEIILKGKKAEKPPHMPGYEAKGMTAEQAKALVDYMRSLRGGGEKKPEPNENTNANAAGNANASGNAKAESEDIPRETIVGMYKTNCVACHGAKADKLYDPKMDLNEQAQVILKGKKAAKPPHMPGYEAKGITERHAKALADYMVELRTPAS